MAREVKQYNFNGLAGCVRQFKSRATGTLVGIYHGLQSGMDADPESKYVCLCEVHSTLVGVKSLSQANITRDPREWCEDCRTRDELGDVFVHIANDVFVCEPCARAAGIDLGDPEVQVWEVGSGGWLPGTEAVCRDCHAEIPIVCDGLGEPPEETDDDLVVDQHHDSRRMGGE